MKSPHFTDVSKMVKGVATMLFVYVIRIYLEQRGGTNHVKQVKNYCRK